MRAVGELIVHAIERRADDQQMAELSEQVRLICARFPVPGLPE